MQVVIAYRRGDAGAMCILTGKNDERAGVCEGLQKNVTSMTDNGGVVYRLECCAGGPGRCMATVAPYNGGIV